MRQNPINPLTESFIVRLTDAPIIDQAFDSALDIQKFQKITHYLMVVPEFRLDRQKHFIALAFLKFGRVSLWLPYGLRNGKTANAVINQILKYFCFLSCELPASSPTRRDRTANCLLRTEEHR